MSAPEHQLEPDDYWDPVEEAEEECPRDTWETPGAFGDDDDGEGEGVGDEGEGEKR